jgi:heme A synthase
MENLVGLLITVIVLGLVFYVVYWLLSKIPLPEPFSVVAQVILGLIVVVVLLGLLFGGINVPVIRLPR